MHSVPTIQMHACVVARTLAVDDVVLPLLAPDLAGGLPTAVAQLLGEDDGSHLQRHAMGWEDPYPRLSLEDTINQPIESIH